MEEQNIFYLNLITSGHPTIKYIVEVTIEDYEELDFYGYLNPDIIYAIIK